MHRLSRLLLAAVATAVVLPPSSSLADGWSPAVAVTPAGASAPSLAADPSGVTAVWLRGGVVEAARRGAFGAFVAPQALSGADASRPAIAVNDAGRAVVVWVRDGLVQAAIRPDAASAFGPAQNVSSSGVDQQPRVGIDTAGNATVAWVRSGVVQVARRTAAAAAWPAAQSFTEANVDNVALAVAPNGAATAVWSARPGPAYRIRTAARHPGAASFLAATTIEEAEDVVGNPLTPQVAVDADGDATAVWANHLVASMTRDPVVRSAERSATGTFGTPQTISGDTVREDAGSPHAHVAVNAAGDALAIWNHRLDETNSVHLARRSAGAAFAQATEASPAGVDVEDDPAVAVDPQARGVALWSQDGRIRASRVTGGVGPSAPLSDVGAARPAVAFDAAGNAVAAWVRAGRVETAAYDVVAPALGAVSVPGGAATGADVAFGAEASDGESGVTFSWSFGDGASASGPSVTHRFAAPGTYDVRVTATDGGGNAVTETRSIVVTGSGGGGGGEQVVVDDRIDIPACGRCGAPVRTATLSALRIAPAKLVAGRGARVTFRLTSAAKVTFTVERAVRRGGRTTFRRVAGSFSAAGTSGVNRVRFKGRLAGRKLRAGRYRLVAKVAGGGETRKAFRVVRAK